MADPRVSVITPAYRAEPYLEEAVRSVMAQTVADWELIIVDDGSPDGTGALAEQFAREDDRIRVIHRPVASGRPAVPRNVALENARGRYIAFLDADDVWYPQKLEKQLAAFDGTDAAIVFAYYDRIDQHGNLLSVVSSPRMVDYSTMLHTCSIGFLTSMIDLYKTGPVRFDENTPWGMKEDYVLWLELLRRGCKAICVPEKLGAYRVVSGSVSRNKWKAARAQWFVYRQKEGLSLWAALYHWVQYAIHGYRKNRRRWLNSKFGEQAAGSVEE